MGDISTLKIFHYLILLCLFLCAYILSRLFIKNDTIHSLIYVMIKTSRGHLSILILLMMTSIALLSTFIPNMITVLTVIPLLQIIYQDFKDMEKKKGELTTPFVLGIIFSANSGGLASLTGSPAHAILLGSIPVIENLEKTTITGSTSINFFSWLLFGIPITIILLLIGWLLITYFTIPRRLRKIELTFPKPSTPALSDRIKIRAIIMTIITALVFIISGILEAILPRYTLYFALPVIIYTLFLIVLLFIIPLPQASGKLSPSLKISDFFHNIPLKGVILALIAVVLSLLLYFLDISHHIGDFISRTLSTIPFGLTLLTLSLALITTFSTELLSNTAIAITLFPVAYRIAATAGYPAIMLLLTVSFSTTCAFMSPIATPVNAFAYGSFPGVSLTRILLVGFCMNILASLIISFFLLAIVPHILL